MNEFEKWFSEWGENYGSNYSELQAAYHAGAAAMREKCAKLATKKSSRCNDHIHCDCDNFIATAIRKIEVG